MRVIYLGAGEFGLPTLEALHAAHEVALVITQPDRPAGRRRQMTATPIGQFAEAHRLPLIRPEIVNAQPILDRIAALQADVMVIVAFGQYLKQSLVSLPRLGAMNLHASLLPRWRGASPINATLLHGDAEAGNTVIRIAKKMDAGDMLGRQAVPVAPRQTAGELHDRLAAMGPQLVLNVISGLDAGTIEPVPQNDGEATAAPKLSRADGYVDWQADATTICCRVHGLTPWPGVTAYYGVNDVDENRHPLLLRRIADERDASTNKPPGTLIDSAGLVAAGRGAVRLLEVQPPGKRVMQWAEFLCGHDVRLGAVFHRNDE
jgi:methionyl-tRNA formyltransferase